MSNKDKMKTTSIHFGVGAAAALLLLQGCATAPQRPTELSAGDVRGYFEVLRSDFNTTKIHTLNQVMKLTAAEAEKFWPIYRNYEQELAVVGARKLALFGEFFRQQQAGTLNDQNSKEMAGQVENQMAIFVDLNIASDMPVVGSSPPAK